MGNTNIVKRNAPKAVVVRKTYIPRPQLPAVPKPVRVYGTYVKQMLKGLGIGVGIVVAFCAPIAAAIVLAVKSGLGSIPVKHLHNGQYYWLIWAVVTLFWYTGVVAFINEADKAKKDRRYRY